MTHTEHLSKTPRGTGSFAALGALPRVHGSGARKTPYLLLALAIGVLLVVPATALAYATIEGPPVYSSAPGLPDGRVYEQVSPANKYGNGAGAPTGSAATDPRDKYGYATAEGNSVLFEGNGPMGESPWAGSEYFVATKNTSGKECPDSGSSSGSGWCTRALVPRAQQPLVALGGILGAKLDYLYPSPDLSHALVEPSGGTLAPQANCGGEQLYLAGPDPLVAATWLEQPELNASENPIKICSDTVGESGGAAGGTPDFSTVYFTYPGTLLPADAERASHAQPKIVGEDRGVEAWGFYEYTEGSLREAGVLPDEKLDPFGAVPAASGHGRAIAGNQVADEGKRAFFVSPDPASCEPHGENDCALDPPELYVRENGEKTMFVSQDTLLPPVDSLPAGAPGGVLQMPNAADQQNAEHEFDGSYVFASPNGSQAFFQSTSALTKAAAEAGSGSEPKTYDFDVNTDALYYLPGVVGQIVATDGDGSSLAFVRPEAGGKPAELDLWSAGPEGNPAGARVTPVVQLPGAPSSGEDDNEPGEKSLQYLYEARLSADGSVLVFTTKASLSSAFNGGGEEEIYRYDVPANTLGCVSCAPAGVAPRGPAWMTSLQAAETYEAYIDGSDVPGLVDGSGMSADGDRIFFDSPDSMVPQDVNADSPPQLCVENETCLQGRDVYEWENGVVYLISTGKSPRNSYLLANSENGSDVFFATTEGLVPGDTDGAYDVYDARIPHPGDNPPEAAVPCEGSVCQGPPNVPSPLTPPASATFSGLGNPAPEPAETQTKTVIKKTTPNARRACATSARRNPRRNTSRLVKRLVGSRGDPNAVSRRRWR